MLPDPTPLAYSYVRFSTPDQAKGDSLRRQTEAAAAWCAKNHVTLDNSLTLHDLGKSAFTGKHRQNADRHALASFLKLVESGRIPHGAHLIVEALDRLTREHIRPALTLVLNLIEAGVRIVQLKPVEQVFSEDVEPMQLMMAIMELARGHSESRMKSIRNGAAWVEKRRLARAGQLQPPRKKDGRITNALTNRLPAWIEDRGGKLVLIPAKAAAVRRVYELAADGYGHGLICKKLTDDGVPALGDTGTWLRAYVAKLLRDRRAVGDFVPCARNGKSKEEAIAGYYPAAIEESLWNQARAAARLRDRLPPGRKRPGRGSTFLNLFDGLLRDARDKDGGSFYLFYRGPKGAAKRFVMNAAGFERRQPIVTFPLDVLEQAILSLLQEIDSREILNGGEGPDESLALAGELERVESSIAAIEADLDEHGESPTLFRRLRAKEEDKRRLVGRLAEARQKAAHPLSESWGQAQSLLATLDAAPDPDDARLRLRSSLRRMIEEIWLLIVPRGRDRLAAVQVWFAGNKRHRDFLIFHRAPWGNARTKIAGSWEVQSLASVVKPGNLDLRRPDHVRRLEAALERLDLQTSEG
jgi:DNA invertase Pin-like site-specific DNA recombinase